MRIIVLVLISILPWMFKKAIYRFCFGYQFSPGARIGLAVVDANKVSMGVNSSIGAFTIIRNLEELSIGEHSKIGTFNWIFGYRIKGGAHFKKETGRVSLLKLDSHSAITSRHLIDCTDTVNIGSYSTIAGFRSQILTHSIDIHTNRQSCGPIDIGPNCFIGTGAIIVMNVSVSARSVVGAGSVVVSSFHNEMYLLAGNPAKEVKLLPTDTEYFKRTSGRVQ